MPPFDLNRAIDRVPSVGTGSTASLWESYPSMADRFLIFVYGTLKKGFPNHDRYMRQARLIGTYRTRDRYRLVLSGERHSPCMMAGAGLGRKVIGELYAVDQAGLEQMDRLERIDLPDGYRRHCITVDRVAGPTPDSRDVFVYLKTPDLVNDLRSGTLETYTPEAARLYRKRTDSGAIGEHDHDCGND